MHFANYVELTTVLSTTLIENLRLLLRLRLFLKFLAKMRLVF